MILTPYGQPDTQTVVSGAQPVMICAPTVTGYPDLSLWRPDLWKEWLK